MKVSLVRESDKKSLDRRVTITMDGSSYTIDANGKKSGPSLTHHSTRQFLTNSELLIEPANGLSWDVKVQYDGDDNSLPSTAKLSYTRPKSTSW